MWTLRPLYAPVFTSFFRNTINGVDIKTYSSTPWYTPFNSSIFFHFRAHFTFRVPTTCTFLCFWIHLFQHFQNTCFYIKILSLRVLVSKLQVIGNFYNELSPMVHKLTVKVPFMTRHDSFLINYTYTDIISLKLTISTTISTTFTITFHMHMVNVHVV